MREVDVQREGVAALRCAGWHVVLLASDKRGRRQHRGLPDALAFRENHTLLIEFKSPTGQRRQSQLDFWLAIRAHLGPNLDYALVDDPHQLAPFCEP